MSNTILIIGESGSGKSTSLRNLNHEETLIINVLGKPFPFKSANKKYTPMSEDRMSGNLFSTDDNSKIITIIRFVNQKRSDIKNLIIDDFSYLMTNEYMYRCMERGFDKYSEMAKNSWQIIRECNQTREDLDCFVIAHSESDDHGRIRCKTIGKVLSNKVNLEGMVTCVLHSVISDGKHKFLTQDSGTHLAKSPMGMFEDKLIDNDLSFVKSKMFNYFNLDI